MGDEELRNWTSNIFQEINQLEHRKYRILSRCCRAAMNGAVELRGYDDPVLLQTYTPELRFCPECGAKLEFQYRHC